MSPRQTTWGHVAGLAVGQDVSERASQLAGPAPQFSLGKSLPGFAPIGPWPVTPDEFDNPDDLVLRCAINGAEVQKGRTRDLIHSVPASVTALLAVLPAGDVIFTGTSVGVGVGRDPQRFLAPDDVLESTIEGIGDLRQTFIA